LKRPNEVEDLVGDPDKIKRNLGWEHEISLEMLVNEMVESDLIAAKNGK
jgi:GDPmannose 4,6-dehydratase